MLDRSGSKFCVEPRSQNPDISYEAKSYLETPKIVSCPGCQPEFPDDADDGDDVLTIFPSGQTPNP